MVKVGGLQKLTLIDYPEKVAATIFLAGCNFRCGFCHNPDLVKNNRQQPIVSEKELFAFLQKRKGLLEGICIGGGEPLVNNDLAKFLIKIKNLGYLVKLDTNGFNSRFLQKLISQKLLDYIAMDIKSSLEQYAKITNIKVDVNQIQESIKIIMASGLYYEFRTTLLPKFHDLEEVEKIAMMIKGARNYSLQRFNNQITLDPAYKDELMFTDHELEAMKKLALKYVKNCQIRS